MEWLGEVFHRVGDGWLLGAMFVWIIFDKTGIIQRVFGRSAATAKYEREQLSDDQRSLVANLERDAENQRRWRNEDAARFHTEMAELRNQLASEIRNSARFRHGLVNLCMRHEAVVNKARALGAEIEPFEWGQFMDIDDVSDKIKAQLLRSQGDKDGGGFAC